MWNKVRFPNMNMIYIARTAESRLRSNQHLFKCSPKYTKNEIKEYLTKVYNLPVVKVNTMIYEGKYKRGFRGKVFKERDFKKAIVTLKEELSTKSS